MASPLFRPIQKPAYSSPIPRSMGTALLLHKIKQSMKPPASGQAHANGHPIIHQPIVVRPAQPTHTNHHSNLPLY